MIKISDSNNSCQKAHSAKFKVLIGIVLFIMTFAVYRQIINHEFITFDDDIYVTDNSSVKNGISLRGVSWAFSLTEKHDSPYWHPLAWLSHMLDCQLFGLNAGMHHLMNLIFHITNTILLFYFLNFATGSVHRSALVAALFAVHPINVDSVAWVAERKNVLSTLFWMLTMIFYIYYTRRPNIPRYLTALLFFFMGLLAKPMLVTIPFVLILIDYWPLERFDLKQSGLHKKILNLVLEKAPFFIISTFSIYISTVSLKLTSNALSTGNVPLILRIENAIVSYAAYIGKIIWPSNLSVYYPFPASIAAWKIIASLILLISVTIYVLFKMNRFRFLGTGWFWFIGTLVPVSGIIQDGLWPAMADRWAYIPYIGLFVIISWGGYELLKKYHLGYLPVAAASVAIIISLSFTSYIQLKHWQNSKSVYKHALEVGSVNHVMLNNMGNMLVKEGKLSEAVSHYKEALLLKPDYAEAYNNLAAVFYKLGRIDESIRYYSEALKYRPNLYKAHNNFGCVLMELGKEKDAMFHFLEALRINPDYAESHNNLGLAYDKLGRPGYAVKHYNEALKLEPNMAEAHVNLGAALCNAGDYNKALYHLDRGAELNPKNNGVREKIKTILEENEKFQKKEKSILENIAGKPDVVALYVGLGDLYVKYKKFDSAEEQYKKAVIVRPDNYEGIIKLAKIYAMKGNFNKALSEAEKVIKLKPDYVYGYYFIASVYSLLNDKEKSIEWLKIAVEKGYDNWDLMRTDKNLNNIRNTSYFLEMTAVR